MFNFYVDNEKREIIGVVCCPTCKTKSVCTFEQMKLLGSATVEKNKTSCHVPSFLFKEQKPTLILFGWEDRFYFVK